MVFDAMTEATNLDIVIWIGFIVFLCVSFFSICWIDEKRRSGQ